MVHIHLLKEYISGFIWVLAPNFQEGGYFSAGGYTCFLTQSKVCGEKAAGKHEDYSFINGGGISYSEVGRKLSKDVYLPQSIFQPHISQQLMKLALPKIESYHLLVRVSEKKRELDEREQNLRTAYLTILLPDLNLTSI